MKGMKRLVSIVVTLCVILSMFPVTALAGPGGGGHPGGGDKETQIFYAADPEEGGTVWPASEKKPQNSQEKPQGSTASANENYTFIGWYNAKGKLVSESTDYVPTEWPGKGQSTTYTAKFAPAQTITITYIASFYDAASGQYVEGTQGGFVKLDDADDADYGLSASETKGTSRYPEGADAEERKGWEFLGWYTQLNGGQLLEDDDDYNPRAWPDASMTVYARFGPKVIPTPTPTATPTPVTLSYVAVGGDSTCVVNPASEPVAKGASTAAGSTAQAGDAWAFEGWFDAETGGNRLGDTLNFVPTAPQDVFQQDTTYYARFAKKAQITYLVVGDDGAAGACQVSPASQYVSDADAAAGSTAAVSAGESWRFVGWYSDAACENLITENAALQLSKPEAGWADATYYARFVKTATLYYALSSENPVYPVGSDTAPGSLSRTSEVVDLNGAVQGSDASAKAGMTLAGWYLDDACETAVDASWVSGNAITPVLPAGGAWTDGTTYYALFDFIDYDVTFQFTGPAPEGVTAPAALTGKHIGDTIDLPALTVPVGYELTWKAYQNENGSAGAEIALDGDGFAMPAGDVLVVGAWKKYTLWINKTFDGSKAPEARIPAFEFDVTLKQGDDVQTQTVTMAAGGAKTVQLPMDIARLRAGAHYTITERSLVDGHYDWGFDAAVYDVWVEGDTVMIKRDAQQSDVQIGQNGADAQVNFTNTYYEPDLTLTIHKTSNLKSSDKVFTYYAQLGHMENGRWKASSDKIALSGSMSIDAILKLTEDQIDALYGGDMIRVWEKEESRLGMTGGWKYDDRVYNLKLDVLRDEKGVYTGRELVVFTENGKVVDRAAVTLTQTEAGKAYARAAVEITFHNTHSNAPTYEEYPVVPVETSIGVRKVWANTTLIPASVDVQLYRNGRAYGSPVSLSASNGWSYIWSGLSMEYTWSVDEVNVPAGYARSVSLDHNVYTITNTYVGSFVVTPGGTSPMPMPVIPQTGDDTNFALWIVLCALGLAGLAAAVVLVRRKRRG
jgi:uncharacterized repeat protein (TIGR02543 family)/LPXTG-motif cell wall-anchored protein